MDFKRTSLSFLCASLIFTCAAFTVSPSKITKPTSKTTNKNNRTKKSKKRSHSLIIAPTSFSSVSSSSMSSLHCFQTPLDFLPTFYSVTKDTTITENSILEITSDDSENQQVDMLSLLDEEANQKTNENDIELDVEEINTIDFSTPNNLVIAPQLLERVVIRENFITSLVDIAVAQEGVPYVHGGKSPKGFDCSGFVSYVYSQFNINLPASSSSYDHVGKKISLKDVQVGDILCFTGRNSHSGRTGHVGIVVESNPNEPIKFIHAASGSRRQITYSTMESSYYKPRFRSARRIAVPILEEILEEIESTESAE
ncbi:C40 family peptidase [Bernardetia sp. OM2101]|uniref:C40 family peptidase n=1 Tax=Bernardetia sp. OM2101 TaxID=3344876 RepID=UPI0035D079A6